MNNKLHLLNYQNFNNFLVIYIIKIKVLIQLICLNFLIERNSNFH